MDVGALSYFNIDKFSTYILLRFFQLRQGESAISSRSFSDVVEHNFINLVDYLTSNKLFVFLTLYRWIMHPAADSRTTISTIRLCLVPEVERMQNFQCQGYCKLVDF